MVKSESKKNNEECFTISVCLCTYNGASFLRPQLFSIFGQTRQPDEVIICDDHSTDGTLTILQEYASKNTKQIRLFVNDTNLGYKRNFARAYSLCHGDIIFFADQDDIWRDDKIERFLSVYSEHPELMMVASNAEMVSQEGNPIRPFIARKRIKQFNRSTNQWKCLLKAPMIPGTSMSIRKAAFESYQPIPKDFLHDEWFSFVASLGNKGYVLEDCTTLYRQHTGQVFGGNQSVVAQAQEQLDYPTIAIKYKSVAYTPTYPITDEVRKALRNKADFLMFRSSLRQRHFFSALVHLLSHPSSFAAYRHFCLHPFLSRVKDVTTRKKV